MYLSISNKAPDTSSSLICAKARFLLYVSCIFCRASSTLADNWGNSSISRHTKGELNHAYYIANCRSSSKDLETSRLLTLAECGTISLVPRDFPTLIFFLDMWKRVQRNDTESYDVPSHRSYRDPNWNAESAVIATRATFQEAGRRDNR